MFYSPPKDTKISICLMTPNIDIRKFALLIFKLSTQSMNFKLKGDTKNYILRFSNA